MKGIFYYHKIWAELYAIRYSSAELFNVKSEIEAKKFCDYANAFLDKNWTKEGD